MLEVIRINVKVSNSERAQEDLLNDEKEND